MIHFPQEIIAAYQDTKPAYKKVYNIVKASIFSNQIHGDEKLTEEGISLALHVSRTPVRTALAQLRSEGILQNVTKSNMGVKEFSRKERLDLVYMAELLEGQAAWLAARRQVPEEDMAALWQIYHDLSSFDSHREETSDNLNGVRDLNMQFHLMIGKASGNSFLYKSIVEIRNLMRMHSSDSPFPKGQTDTYAGIIAPSHKKILDAIEAKDAQTAQLWIQAEIAMARDAYAASRIDPDYSGK